MLIREWQRGVQREDSGLVISIFHNLDLQRAT
jgi:hypothetical protein